MKSQMLSPEVSFSWWVGLQFLYHVAKRERERERVREREREEREAERERVSNYFSDRQTHESRL